MKANIDQKLEVKVEISDSDYPDIQKLVDKIAIETKNKAIDLDVSPLSKAKYGYSYEIRFCLLGPVTFEPEKLRDWASEYKLVCRQIDVKPCFKS